ncbi:MAG: OmpA family protein [Pseudomonadota bacterium]
MKLKTSLLAAAATLATAPAALAYEGFYGAIGAGLSYVQPDRDFETKLVSGADAFDSEADFDNGIGVYTALGYAFDNDWRAELEFSYRENELRHLAGDGLGFSGWPDSVDGDTESYAFMANLIRDFDTGQAVTPYIGGGVGGIRIEADYTGNNTTAINGPLTLDINDGVTRLAFQGIAGLAIELADNLTLDLSYRYLHALKADLEGTLNGADVNFKHGYDVHSAFAGLRWNFGAAPPPAVEYKDCWDGSSVPLTAECPPQLVETQAAIPDPIDFIVYFDYDKSSLTPEAASLVREAAQRALANDIETVVVEGNTDTVGSSGYNQALSLRRAEAVERALIANGVPAERIDTRALGETNLAKPTPDGTREPLNRRAEVTISFE